VFDERDGPEVKLVIGKLKLVKRRDVWGVYFRKNPVEIDWTDFKAMRRFRPCRAAR
jgi:hypothetical protein